MARAVIFDVNETLLDLAALDPLFLVWFGDAAVRRAWFALTLHYAMTLAATRAHRSFGDVGAVALSELTRQRNVVLPDYAGELLRESVRRLPAHPDVEPGLRLLQKAGLTLAALSNNPLPVIQEQMRANGLTGYFSEIMSVDEAGALKPAPEVYRFACQRLAVEPGEAWMVAAHGWDVAGAVRAGMHGAFVARPGQLPDPFVNPAVTGPDLITVGKAILVADKSS